MFAKHQIAFLVFAGLTTLVHAVPALSATEFQNENTPAKRQSPGTCPAPFDIKTTASKPSPFNIISEAELQELVTWLSAPERKLNLTDYTSPNLSQSDTYLAFIEPLISNKTDVLAYLDGYSSAPTRYARVVGPILIDATTQIRELDYIYNGVNGARIPFNGRYGDGVRSKAIESIVVKTMSSLADITIDLCGFAYYGAADERTNASYFAHSPGSLDGSSAMIWTPWRRAGLAPYTQPSDLYVSFDVSGTDSSLYFMRMIVYNLVVYTSLDDFREAWTSGNITKTPPPPEGKRYKVDNDNKYVEYLEWSFYTRFNRDVGIQFFDIKYKGERILYELSLQDAIAQYAGNNRFQASTGYNDRYYGIGADIGRLIPGICIFESDIGTPITRHTDSSYMQSTKGSKLVVGVIATVGNYDYLWDYQFFVDGSIGIDAHASGYVQANYYRPDDEGKWGSRIQEAISSTLHTHVMNFKADFDLITPENTFLKTDIIVENTTQPWFPELGTFEMMRYNFTEIATEDDGVLPAPANGQSMYTVINKDQKNKWGESRGYRIIQGLSNIHLALQNSPWFLKSAEYAKQAFAVSRHHDEEPASSAAYSQNLPHAPPVEFWGFFNGENLVQEDIVAWVNLGMHHYTRSEDIPNTLMTEAHSSVIFAPHNWGTTEDTVDLTNAIIYNKPSDVSSTNLVAPDTNGVNASVCFPILRQDTLLGVFEHTGTSKEFEVPSAGGD
ncbi:copper amine oxidase [Tothia fuscella]|uniref:Amine oxidase n=1 Tax=Tothia fuscella TaxID=1048955 RepID=A0A9P4NDL7_9PEZI|nr:copper amine oxidase [Tothia fuscella]